MSMYGKESEGHKFTKSVKLLIDEYVNNKKLLLGDYVYGVVDEILSGYRLRVRINGRKDSEIIRGAKNITFQKGDKILILCVNKSQVDRVAIAIV